VTKRPGTTRPCTGCKKWVRSITGMCQQCLRPPRAPSHPCAYCGITTRSEDRLCIVCAPHAATAGKVSPDGDGLPDGDWVLDRRTRILVWQGTAA
jgi:predicted amidophosphoribosyltransferase